MVFSQMLFCVPRKKAPGKSRKSKGKGSPSTISAQPEKKQLRHTISSLVQLLKRRTKARKKAHNKVGCSPCSLTNANYMAPTEVSGRTLPFISKAQDQGADTTNTTVTSKGNTTKVTKKDLVSPKYPRVSSLRRVSFNHPSTPSTPPAPLSQRGGHSLPQLGAGETQLQVKTLSEYDIPLRLCIKYNSWTMSPESHPLSESHHSPETMFYDKRKPENKPEKCDIRGKKDSGAKGESEKASENAPLQNLNRTFFDLSVKQFPPSSYTSNDNAMDRITRYCTVDLDTDFIANFNFDFLNDNVI